MPDLSTSEKIVEIADQGDRILLYPEQNPSRFGRYCIIGSKETVRGISVGDRVKYEPYGVNFGWLVSKVGKKCKRS